MATLLVTLFTLIAFAANSLLCRMALGGELIDPVSFTTLRLASGALALVTISRLVSERKEPQQPRGSWASGLALFAYAGAFSLAYTSLNAGTGAVILFGSVQVTMIGAALKGGERLRPTQWLGSAAALIGLIYLVLPGISAPDPLGALLMMISGIAWGIYSIRGKGVSAPIAMTARNFTRAAPMAIAASLIAISMVYLEPYGILLALISGVVTSGLGYALWYKALRNLTTPQASIVQLMVPVLAAFGGVVFLSEEISSRLIIASTIILGGITFAVIKMTPKRVRLGRGDRSD
ncbi:MAG: EamA family transporter [Ignavibacteriae bacterium]|nr:EamA family transporter [Ignavibacteriota bacterium]MCB9214595.1 EamA family transporter [Ignavibacteria bacterium]